MWKEESLERSFYPQNLRKMFEKKFHVIKFTFDHDPESPPIVHRRWYYDLYCKFVTKTKIFLPFLGGITLVAEKTR